MHPVLDAKDLHLEFNCGRGAVQVLKGIDFTLVRGERACVIGPSGSGKSSFLMVLGGLLRPTSGVVHHEGRPLPKNPDEAASLRRARLGFILQEPLLIPYLTVRENVLAAALDDHFGGTINAKAERLGITGLLDERPAYLSVGERQRGCILRAIINDPEIILADEPTANLDLGGGLEVVKLLKENLGGASLVLVTHDTRIIDESFAVYKIENGILEKGRA
jgi:putative ABC transport system ATP-binding protein